MRNQRMGVHFFLPAVLSAGLVLLACSLSGPGEGNDYLIRVGQQVVTVADYQRAFEIAQAAYPHNVIQDPTEYRKAQVRLLNQMTEELILLERARELDIRVSDQDVENKIADIKKDYPDDLFEQTLLEYAVSYKSWKEGLKSRLLMERLVEKELNDQVVITPDEIARYYKENYRDDPLKPDLSEDSVEIDEMIVQHLRRIKTEKAYRDWIEKIQKAYTIEINQQQWKKILAAPQRGPDEKKP